MAEPVKMRLAKDAPRQNPRRCERQEQSEFMRRASGGAEGRDHRESRRSSRWESPPSANNTKPEWGGNHRIHSSPSRLDLANAFAAIRATSWRTGSAPEMNQGCPVRAASGPSGGPRQPDDAEPSSPGTHRAQGVHLGSTVCGPCSSGVPAERNRSEPKLRRSIRG